MPALLAIPSPTFRFGDRHPSLPFCASSRHRNLGFKSRVTCSGLQSGRQDLLCLRLTSASSSPRFSTWVARGKRADLPGLCASSFPLMPSHIRPRLSYRYWTLEILDSSSGMVGSFALPVRRARVFPAASFRFHLAVGTLAVRLTVPPVGSVEDLNLQVVVPCRAH